MSQALLKKLEVRSRSSKRAILCSRTSVWTIAAATHKTRWGQTAKLSAGQTGVIHGGSGGVGSFAIQIAKDRGAKVIATASTANQDFLKQLGADVAIDYTKQKFEDVAKDVDVVLDS